MTLPDLARENAVLHAANSELVDANEALVLSAGRYLALHELAPVPLLTLTPAGIIVDVNLAAESLLGAPRAELLHCDFATYVSVATGAQLKAQLRQLFASGAARGLELTLDGPGAHVEVAIDAVVLPGMGPLRAVLACVDVTARKLEETRRQALLAQAEEAHRLQSLGVLASGIAHGFNNLMTIVVAGAEAVAVELPEASPHSTALGEVLDAARQAGELAHQMLAYSGHTSVPARPVDVGALVRELEPLLRVAARTTPVVLDVVATAAEVLGDPSQLRQVVINLVINAAEAMVSRPGVITVRVQREQPANATGDFVLLEVGDFGVGMTPATRARMFEPYFSTKFVGRGLGLAVVHGVVRGHGGVTEVATVPESGSTFRVFFPATESSASGPASLADPDWRGIGTVLLVDDDAGIRRTVTRLLAKLGLAVVGADGAQEALCALARGPIDLVLTDLMMPDVDGIALATTIRTMHPELPIVLVTGYAKLPEASAGIFNAALAKPFDMAMLRATLQLLLPRAEL